MTDNFCVNQHSSYTVRSATRSLLLILIGISLGAAALHAQPVVDGERLSIYPVERPPWYDFAVLTGTRSEDGRPGPEYWQQYATYELHARLLTEERRLEGSARIVYQNNSPNTLEQLHLDLYQNLHAPGAVRAEEAEVTGGVEITRVVAGGMALQENDFRRPYYQVVSTRLAMLPPRRIAPGDTISIEIDWAFDVPSAGAGDRMGYDRDNLFFIAYWYPQMAVYDDVIGWHPDPFRGRAEFYHGFADYSLTVEAPDDWVVMGTGAFINPEETLSPQVLERYRAAGESDDVIPILLPEDFGSAGTAGDGTGSLTWRFHAEQVRDVAFSATRKALWDGARAPVGAAADTYTRLNTFYRETAPLWSEVTAYQQHSITFLSDFAGFPYPWPHMTAVEGAGIIGGGMEFPMMTVIDDYNTRGAEALYSVTAHEIAHMWVPMIVSTDERRFSWLDEGNTTFSTDAAKNDFLPGIDHHESTRQSYINFAMTGQEGPMMRWSDFHYTWAAFGIASYHKPATVLAALRGVLGEADFQQAYREFINTWAYKHPYPWDMFRTFERVSGRDLGWFWRTWYYETWILDQRIDTVEQVAGGTRIIVQDEGEAPMPVHLTILLADGQTVEEVIPVDVWLDGATSAEVIVPYTNVVQVEIDAERHFPHVDRISNIWARREAATTE